MTLPIEDRAKSLLAWAEQIAVAAQNMPLALVEKAIFRSCEQVKGQFPPGIFDLKENIKKEYTRWVKEENQKRLKLEAPEIDANLNTAALEIAYGLMNGTLTKSEANKRFEELGIFNKHDGIVL